MKKIIVVVTLAMLQLHADKIDDLATGLSLIKSESQPWQQQQSFQQLQEMLKKLQQQAEQKPPIQQQKPPKEKENIIENIPVVQPEKPKEEKAEESLLGPWMVKNKPKNLVAYNENFDGKGNKVYQIEVLRQWKDDCWIHSFRNGMFIMDLALSPRKDFNKIYKDMITREQYEAFTKHGCPMVGTLSKNFIQQQLDCRPNCIPEKSLEYIGNTLYLNYEPTFDTQELEKAKNDLNSVENNQNNQKIITDYALLSLGVNLQINNIDRLITIFHTLYTSKDFCCFIDLGCKSINHDTTLVIHKQNNAIEYLFSDSNNLSFKGDNFKQEQGNIKIYYAMSEDEYKKNALVFSSGIKKIISFVENPQHFDDMMVRMLYALMMEKYEINKVDKTLSKFPQAIQTHNLTNNSLYQSIYKKAYEELMIKTLFDISKKRYDFIKNSTANDIDDTDLTKFDKDIQRYNLSNNSLYQTYKKLHEDLMVEILYHTTIKFYNGYKKSNIDEFGMDNWRRIAQYSVPELEKFYLKIKTQNLLNNQLYQSNYKQQYCTLIKQEQRIQNNDTKYYGPLLQKVGC